MRPCAFAIPGDHHQKSGGYIYERRLLEELQASGRDVRHIQLPAKAAAADPGTQARRVTEAALAALPPDLPLILDGLAFAAMRTKDLARLPNPVVAMLHHPMGLEHGFTREVSDMLLAQEAANLSHAAHVVVTSPHTRDAYVGLGADPAHITVALPGHDGPRDLPLEDTGPNILSVGLLARRKGHDVLIRALALIADLDWHTRIVGKTPDPAIATELAALIVDHGLQDRVELVGELSDDALSAAYRTARIFALATRHEGYGMALAEALIHGLPIVSCAVGAVPGTVGNAALLAPPDSPKAFAQHLRCLLTSATMREELGARARARGLVLPSWKETAAVMAGVLDGL